MHTHYANAKWARDSVAYVHKYGKIEINECYEPYVLGTEGTNGWLGGLPKELLSIAQNLIKLLFLICG